MKVFKELELTAEDYAFAVKKGNTEFKTSINAILDEMGDDGSLETLINSYFDGTATFTYENKSSSPQTGDLVVATNAYFPPFEYFEGNKFKGVDIEIALENSDEARQNFICQRYGFRGNHSKRGER